MVAKLCHAAQEAQHFGKSKLGHRLCRPSDWEGLRCLSEVSMLGDQKLCTEHTSLQGNGMYQNETGSREPLPQAVLVHVTLSSTVFCLHLQQAERLWQVPGHCDLDCSMWRLETCNNTGPIQSMLQKEALAAVPQSSEGRLRSVLD